MEEDIENALNNLWNSLDDEFFNLTYSQEEMQEDMRIILNRYNYLDSKLQNLINKYKEQEKIIELMAEQLAVYKFEEIICMEIECEHVELQNEGKCIGDKTCILEYYKKKVKGE